MADNDVVEVERLPQEDTERLSRCFPNYSEAGGPVRTKKGDYFFLGYYNEIKDEIANMKLNKSDVFVVSHPKCGTTMTQQMVAALILGIDKMEKAHLELEWIFPDFDVHGRKLEERLPWQMELLQKSSSKQRLIKSHLPFSLLPKNILEECKVIYIARNPKDTVVSWHNHHLVFPMFNPFNGTIEDFADCFMNNETLWSPYWNHLKEAADRKDNPNLLILTFEEVRGDTKAHVNKVAQFLGKDISEEELSAVVDYLDFDKRKACFQEMFKDMPTINHDVYQKEGRTFLWKGQVGNWKGKLKPETVDKMDKWIEENSKDLDFNFLK